MLKRIFKVISIMIVGLLLSSIATAGTMQRESGATPFVYVRSSEYNTTLDLGVTLRTLTLDGEIYIENIDEVEEGELIAVVKNSNDEVISLERIYQAATISLEEEGIYQIELEFWNNGSLEQVGTIETFYIKEVK